MRVLALSDIHGALGEVGRILEREPDRDVVVIAGDFTTYGSDGDLIRIVESVRAAGSPVIAVCGNMDPPPLDATLAGLGVSANGRGIVVGDAGFFGVSGATISPLKTPNEITEEETLARAEAGWENVRDCRWKVFVPHAPPAGTLLDRIRSGAHVGSTAVRSFVERRVPDAVVCGHIHESSGTDRLGRSVLVNCGPAGQGHYAILTLGESVAVTTHQLGAR